MPLPVKLNDIIEALEEASEDISHFLDRRTGEIFQLTDEDISAARKDKSLSAYPEWQQESILKAREILNSEEFFVELPDRYQIHEYEIMAEFALDLENPDDSKYLRRLIQGPSAFRRFRHAIEPMGLEKDWHHFHHQALEDLAPPGSPLHTRWDFRDLKRN